MCNISDFANPLFVPPVYQVTHQKGFLTLPDQKLYVFTFILDGYFDCFGARGRVNGMCVCLCRDVRKRSSSKKNHKHVDRF